MKTGESGRVVYIAVTGSLTSSGERGISIFWKVMTIFFLNLLLVGFMAQAEKPFKVIYLKQKRCLKIIFWNEVEETWVKLWNLQAPFDGRHGLNIFSAKAVPQWGLQSMTSSESTEGAWKQIRWRGLWSIVTIGKNLDCQFSVCWWERCTNMNEWFGFGWEDATNLYGFLATLFLWEQFIVLDFCVFLFLSWDFIYINNVIRKMDGDSCLVFGLEEVFLLISYVNLLNFSVIHTYFWTISKKWNFKRIRFWWDTFR